MPMDDYDGRHNDSYRYVIHTFDSDDDILQPIHEFESHHNLGMTRRIMEEIAMEVAKVKGGMKLFDARTITSMAVRYRFHGASEIGTHWILCMVWRGNRRELTGFATQHLNEEMKK